MIIKSNKYMPYIANIRHNNIVLWLLSKLTTTESIQK